MNKTAKFYITMKAKLKLASLTIPRPGMSGSWLLSVIVRQRIEPRYQVSNFPLMNRGDLLVHTSLIELLGFSSVKPVCVIFYLFDIDVVDDISMLTRDT